MCGGACGKMDKGGWGPERRETRIILPGRSSPQGAGHGGQPQNLCGEVPLSFEDVR